MKKNNLTEMVFILDASGSMAGLENDTIGGFNSMIGKQKNVNGKAFVTSVMFNHEYKIVHDRESISKINYMTHDDYVPMGSTALIDAIGKTIKHIENIHKYARPSDVPSKTVFVIMTDGMENASRIFSSDEVKQMIEKEKKVNGWEFLFLGANIDAVETAKLYGISADRAVTFNCDKKGTALNYEVVSDAVCSIRHEEPLSPCWSARIQADYNSRKQGN